MSAPEIMQQPKCPAACLPPASPEWSAAAITSGLAADSGVLLSQLSVPCPPVPQPAANNGAVGMKRIRSSGAFSAFEPYPLGGPAATVLAHRAKRLRSLSPSAQLADAAAATQSASQTSSESAGSAGGCRSSATTATATADSASVAAEAALAAYQARKHLQMLRRAASLLPKLPPAAQAVLLLRLRAVARRRAAAAAAPKPVLAGARPPAPRPRPDPEMDRALFSRGMAFIQAGMPPADVAALTQARAFLASFP